MSHLISTYAKNTGLKIGRPDLMSHYVAIPFTRYITVQTGSGQAAKNYDYWQEVIAMVGPILAARQVAIVLMGGKDDPLLQGVYDMRGKTTPQQAQFLIQNALLHMGNDSWLVHCAGWNRRPVVGLYGSTSAHNHGPYWKDPAKTALLSSHRHGGVPTYSSNENPKTVNLITVEEVSNAALRLLDLSDTAAFTQQSRLFGLLYNHALFDLVPDAVLDPASLPGVPMTVRMDILHREDVLAAILNTGRKINILTKAPIDIKLLAHLRPGILSYTHEIDENCPLEYPPTVASVIKNATFYTKESDPVKLEALRYRFFDICAIQKVVDLTKDDYINAALVYLNWGPERRSDLEREITDGTLTFKSNRYLIAAGKMHLTQAHLNRGVSTESLATNQGPVIDDPDFWSSINHLYLFNQPTVSVPTTS